MIEGQAVSGLHLLSIQRPIEKIQAGQVRNCVLDYSSPIINATTIYDMSGKGNHGTITGATWVRLPSGLPGLSFDGTDDYITINNIQFTTGMTLEVWAKDFNTVGNRELFGSWEYSAGNFRSFGFRVEDGNVQFWMSPDGTSANAKNILTAFTVDGTAVYLAATWDGTTMRVHKNGVVDANTNTMAACYYNATYKIYSGVLNAAKENDFLGKMFLWRITNVARTAEQLINTYNQTRHLFGV